MTTLAAAQAGARTALDYLTQPVPPPVTIPDTAPLPRQPGTSDTAYLQGLLDRGGYVVIPPGRYVCDGLTIKSGTKLYGPGVTISASPTLPAERPLLGNEHQVGDIDVYYDRDVVIDGIIFDGAMVSHTQPLVCLIKTQNCTIIDCTIKSTPYIGLGIANGSDNVVTRSVFTGTGNPVETPEGGAAVWIGALSGNRCLTTEISNCLFADLQWSAVYLGGEGPILTGCTIEHTMESAVFAANDCVNPVIRSNRIRTTRRKHISSSGLELGTSGALVEGNVIEDCGNGCIDLMGSDSGMKDVIVRDNITRNCGQEVMYASFAGCIQMVTMPGSLPSHNIVIENNWMTSDGTPLVTALRFDRQNGAPQVYDVLATGNNAAGSTWAQAFYAASGMRGANCRIYDNTGF